MKTKTNLSQTNPRPECCAEATTFLSAVYKRGTQAKKRQAYAPQYGRLLSLCTEDTLQVSNDVYNQRYTSEKVESRYKQSGRSMIEMLGVLAIIGVLTVGSITGYSHAMRRHLLNKQREQISYILSAVETNREMVDTSVSSTQSYNLKPAFETFGWIPEEMIRETDNYYIYDVFKNRIYPYSAYDNSNRAFMSFKIYLTNDNPHEQCVNIYQMIQQYHSFLWRIQIRRQASDHTDFVNLYYGDKDCDRSFQCLRDLTPAKISKLCRICDEVNACEFQILWIHKLSSEP